MEKYGSIDAFISCIGYYGVETLDTFKLNTFKKTMKVNIDVPTEFIVTLINKEMLNKNAKCIFITSAAAYIGSRDLSYSISKAAVLGLIKGIAKSKEAEDLYVYGIAPGIVETTMSDNMNVNRQSDTIKRTINKRKCTSEEIANLVEFLIIKEKGYMNGTIIHMNNGLFNI